MHTYEARARITKTNLWVRISSSEVGVFLVNGVGLNKFGACPEIHEKWAFGRISRENCHDITGVPESLRTKRLCSFSVTVFELDKCPPLRKDYLHILVFSELIRLRASLQLHNIISTE